MTTSSGLGLQRTQSAPWPYLTPAMSHQKQHLISLSFRFISAKTGVVLLSAFSFLFRLQTSQDTLFIANCFYSTFHNHCSELMTLFNITGFFYFMIPYLPCSNWKKETPHLGKTFIIMNLKPWNNISGTELPNLLLTNDGILASRMQYSCSTFTKCFEKWKFWNQVLLCKPPYSATSFQIHITSWCMEQVPCIIGEELIGGVPSPYQPPESFPMHREVQHTNIDSVELKLQTDWKDKGFAESSVVLQSPRCFKSSLRDQPCHWRLMGNHGWASNSSSCK